MDLAANIRSRQKTMNGYQRFSTWTLFQPNSIRTSLWNNGVYFCDSIPESPKEGMFWPANTSNPLQYAAGLWVSGKDEHGTVRTALSYYKSFYQPGRINGIFNDTNYSVASSFSDPRFNMLLLSDTATPADPMYQRWVNDAAVTGVPLTGTGAPLLYGNLNAYWVMNDLDTTSYRLIIPHDPLPMGLEINNYVFAFGDPDPLSNAIFIVMDIANRSTHTYDSAFVGWWNDIDLGAPLQNFAGCDTVLSLGFMYHDQYADMYYGNKPPACGYVVLESPTSKAGKSPMTSFMKDTKFRWQFPGWGSTNNDIAYRNSLEGKLPNGERLRPPTDSSKTITFANPGDPISATGWNASDDEFSHDVKELLGSGPFTLKPNQSVRFALAFIVAQDTGRLSSIRKLKEAVPAIRSKWTAVVYAPEERDQQKIPTDFSLSNSYPNPFNPSSTIRYTLPQKSFVTLKVYDVLGRVITTLVNEEKPAGSYDVTFNASQLSSGIYFCNFQAGAFSSARKMLLMK